MSNLKKILIKTKKQVFSEIAGNNPSLMRGDGFEFVELREYSAEDDIKHINWQVTAKLQKPFVKVYAQEKELNIVIVPLLSGSVYFGQKRMKQDLIAEISSILSYSAVRNSDRFSAYFYSDKLDSMIKPTKKIFAVNELVEKILNYDSLNNTVDYKKLHQFLMQRIKRKAVVFLIGDFFGDFNFSTLAKKHEVIAIITRDELEENPPKFGNVNLIDPNSLSSELVDFSGNSVDKFREMMRENDKKLYINFRKHHIRFTKIYTQEEPFVKLMKLFRGQR